MRGKVQFLPTYNLSKMLHRNHGESLHMTSMSRISAFLFVISLCLCSVLLPAKAPKAVSGKQFDAAAQAALEAMKKKAAELQISGVAVVAFAPGEKVETWQSQMAVVGYMTDHKSEKGNNLLGIAYAKAAEMAETLQDSGTAGRPPMTGEFGWHGGVVGRTERGVLIVAFSGGKSEDDIQVSKTGLGVLKARL